MTLFALDALGRLTPQQTLSTLAPGVPAAGNTGAEVWVHPSGRFLYGSNRGDDSIVVYSLDAAGKMSWTANVKTGGATPRSFTVEPGGRWLLVANQGSNNVTVLSIDSMTGVPALIGQPHTVSAPSFVGVVLVPAV
jgi:6-phosphogluconolactonase